MLSLSDLHSFAVLAGELHFGRAAALLHVSQPALSKQISRMEQKLGGPLLVRRYRRVSLTAAGGVLRDRARLILQDADAAEELARLAMRGEAGVLRIGFGIASLSTRLPSLVAHYRDRYPSVQIAMRDMSTPDQIAALERKDIDVGFVRLPRAEAGLESLPVLHERLIIALGPGMPYDRRAGLSSLRAQPFIVTSRSTSASYYDHVVATCRAAGFAPRIVQEASELFTVLNLVRAGIGVSLVPTSARLMQVPNVVFEETRRKEAEWQIGLAWNQEALPPVAQNFIRLAREEFRVKARKSGAAT